MNKTRQHLRNKGRNRGRFVALPYSMLESEAWKDLNPQAALIFIELKRRYNGGNNGEISLSCREAAEVAHCGKGTANKRLVELADHGFIKPNEKGYFHNRHASTWILTCESFGKFAPSNEWKDYRKNKTPCL